MKTIIKSALLATTVTAMTMGVFADELKFPVGSGDFSWDTLEPFEKMKLKGEKITLFGPWLSSDEKLVESVIAYFEHATGVDVEYTGSDSFEQQIAIDVQAGGPPNIAIFPQPGLAADMASKGFLIPLGNKSARWVKKNYAAGQSWVDLGTYKNEKGKKDYFGFFYKVDLKSLVWYSPDNFDDWGYDIPDSMEGLLALSDRMVKDGNTPWCIGLGSGAATGWPATDWVEDMMLRTQSPKVYDAWVTNDIKFNDKRVLEAIDAFGQFAKNEDYVAGGVSSVGSTDFRDSPKGLFSSPARCFLHRQASFIPSFFPEGTELGVDADFFYFPSYANKKLGNPVLGAGTLWSITKDSKATRAFMEFLQSPIAHEIWMAQAAFLTPHKGVNVKLYANDTLRKQGEILLNATTFRFDGSDLMPGPVGAGSFWTGMVDYVGGDSASEVGNAIQKSWDTIK